ncbi:MAG: hypothetical protein A3H97_23830 [Acidobacteria bacterium RIFCSPLOWO2_02_FULL_65_29]|nr:MAG: hypothetical protein A3H97_23830 [Acidobacteria bacterium RIFCSPLOWO2_02_FULL_65_29]
MRSKLTLVALLACLLSSGLAFISAQVATEKSPKIWVGRYEELEAFIKTAPIVRAEDIPIGVTRPRHGFFAPGGLVGGVAIKALRPSRDTGYFESYQSEIAAYEVDKLLQLDMVPPTVERTFEGKTVSAQLWVDGVVQRNSLKGQEPPNPLDWNRQTRRWIVFHNLVANVDPNQGNLLVLREPNWQLVLVDHSRAFTNTTKMVFEMTGTDRPFFERVKALDKATLDAKIGKLVLDGSRSILRRRDLIVAQLEKLAKEKGEAAVFTP